MGHIFAAAFFDVNKDADVVTKGVVQKGYLWMWLGVWFTIEFTINWYSGHKGLLASAVVKGWRAGSERFGESSFFRKSWVRNVKNLDSMRTQDASGNL